MRQPSLPGMYILPTEHVAALNAVDVRLYGCVHGERVMDMHYGPAILGVTASDYTGAANVVAELRPERGDVLACEAIEYRGSPVWRPTDVIRGLQANTAGSSFIDEQLASGLIGDSLYAPPAPDDIVMNYYDYLRPNKIKEFLDIAQAYRVINPLAYAQGLAVIKGIACIPADAGAQEAHDFRINQARYRDGLPLFKKYLPKEVFIANREEKYFRDGRMVHRLGAIAMEITIRDPEDPPKLAFIHGPGHERHLRQILTANGIAHTSDSISPDWTVRKRKDIVRAVVRSVWPFMQSPDEREKADWIANAEAEYQARTSLGSS